MKNILSLLALMLVHFSFSQNIIKNYSTENLKGNPKEYIQNTSVLNTESGKFINKYNTHMFFNTIGNVTRIDNLSEKGDIISREEFLFDKDKLTQIITYNAKGTVSKKSIYEYNAENLLISEKKYNNKGKLQFDTRFLYNNKGQITASQKLIPSINYTVKIRYKYDDKDRLIESIKSGRIGDTKERFEYDDNNQIIKKMEFNALNEMYSYTVYSYNDNSDKISLKKYDNKDRLTYYESYKYQYDTAQNWIEKISFEKNVKMRIDKRKINY